MAQFDEVEEALEESLILPIRGKDGKLRKYEIKPCDAERWVRMMALQQVQADFRAGVASAPGDIASVQSSSQRSMLDDALGKTLVDKMIRDGVRPGTLARAGATAMVYHLDGLDEARVAWSGKEELPKTPSDKDGGEDPEMNTDSTPGTSTPKK